MEKLARLPLKTVDITIEPDAVYIPWGFWQPPSLRELQIAAEALKPELLRSWEEIKQEQMEAREAADTASELVHGSLVSRRRAGQLRRGVKKAA